MGDEERMPFKVFLWFFDFESKHRLLTPFWIKRFFREINQSRAADEDSINFEDFSLGLWRYCVIDFDMCCALSFRLLSRVGGAIDNEVIQGPEKTEPQSSPDDDEGDGEGDGEGEGKWAALTAVSD